MAPKFQNNRNQNQNNFFTKAIQRYGENFTERMNAQEMKNGAIQLFREIARGRIDSSKYGHYFLDTQFMETCLAEAVEKLNFHAINYQGLNWFINTNGATNMHLVVLEQNRRSVCAYDAIVKCLVNIKATGDTSHLCALGNMLRNFRNSI